MDLTFTAHLLPVQRGILCTTVARLLAGASPQALTAALGDAYGHEPFIELRSSADAVGSGRARTAAAVSRRICRTTSAPRSPSRRACGSSFLMCSPP